jgi:hypothetical protein
MPFDRNQAGQTILQKKVVEGTLVRGRQMQFAVKLLKSMQPAMERSEWVRVRIDAAEFKEGMIRKRSVDRVASEFLTTTILASA